MLEAIAAGKHVVTANKALLAVHGTEIFAAARAKGVVVAFEAAVAGGIPIIKALREGLTANRIEWIAGIINGTTNFILSEMRAKGLDFGVVLKEAQALGYAEADPTFDIEGIDAAHKATHHERHRLRHPGAVRQGPRRGHHRAAGGRHPLCRAAGLPHQAAGHHQARADHGHRAARAPDAGPGHAADRQRRRRDERRGGAGRRRRHHAVLRQGRRRRADRRAVVADLVDITRLHTADPDHRVPHLAFQPGALQDTPILPIDEVVTAFYLRLQVADEAGVLARITGILAEHDISIDAVLQRESAEGEKQTDLIILTHDTVEGRMKTALAQMQALPTVLAPIVSIRKEELN